jgi:hypothetical protein
MKKTIRKINKKILSDIDKKFIEESKSLLRMAKEQRSVKFYGFLKALK